MRSADGGALTVGEAGKGVPGLFITLFAAMGWARHRHNIEDRRPLGARKGHVDGLASHGDVEHLAGAAGG